MKKEKKYNLKEVIKSQYKTKPLNIDLSVTVANKVFGARKKTTLAIDKWLYILLGSIFIAVIIFCSNYFHNMAVSPVLLLLIIPIALYFWLTLKEVSQFSQQSTKYS